MIPLRQNTACEIIIGQHGPILDCVDGKTPVEVLNLSEITAAIYKGSTRTELTLTASGGDNNFTHSADGYWKLTLVADDTDTLGQLKITLRDDDVFLAVSEVFEVIPANVYDSLYAGSGNWEAVLTEDYDAAKTAAQTGEAAAAVAGLNNLSADDVLDVITAGRPILKG